jgi:hypothetical protein
MLSKARQELESFFAADSELEAGKARGDIPNINYLIKKQHIRELLGERAPLALQALSFTENFLYHAPLGSREELAKKTRAVIVDARILTPWYDEIRDKNRSRIALAILDAMLTVEVPEVPTVPPETLTRYIESHGFIADKEGRRAAWINHELVIDPAVPTQGQL